MLWSLVAAPATFSLPHKRTSPRQNYEVHCIAYVFHDEAKKAAYAMICSLCWQYPWRTTRTPRRGQEPPLQRTRSFQRSKKRGTGAPKTSHGDWGRRSDNAANKRHQRKVSRRRCGRFRNTRRGKGFSISGAHKRSTIACMPEALNDEIKWHSA